MLLGRVAECEAVDRLADAVRSGQGGALVLRGDAGVGKSALLAYARDRAGEMLVLQATGIESDAELPFGALHQLLRSFLGRVERLPAPQAAAINAALGLAAERPRDRFLVGAGALGLLSDAATERPVLCLVDDAHWVDRESLDALLFVARRLEAEAVAIVFATRDSGGFASDLATLWVAPLGERDARTLLAGRNPDLEPAAQERIVKTAAGNPLALVELAGWSAAVDAEPSSALTSLERAYLDVIRELPPETQLLLMLAAAAETGELAWITHAAAKLDLDVEALAPAERAAIVAVDAGVVRFRHPLVRSAAYRGSSFLQRQRAHEALAAVLDDEQADRRAWHRAAAVAGPDEDVAADLERTAARAQRRGGQAAVSAALERAADLSRDERARVRRLIAAAEAAWQAGDAARTQRLLEETHVSDDAALRSTSARLRGLVNAQAGRPGDAAAMLTESAKELASAAPARSLRLAALAAETAWFAGDGARLSELERLARSLGDEDGDESRFAHAFIEGLTAAFDLTSARTFSALATASALAGALTDGRMISWGGDCADLLGDAVRANELHNKGVARARDEPAIGDLVYGLYVLARSELSLGRLAPATADASEGLRLAREMEEPGSAAHLTALMARVAALRGDADACRALAAEALEQAVPAGLALATSEATLALAEIELALADPADALVRLEPLTAATAHPAYRIKAVPLLVEAAARAGEAARAQAPLASATAWVEQSGGQTLLPQIARCRALVSNGAAAEQAFTDALRLHARCQVPLDRARTQLAYGEQLRRLKRKADARAQLRPALETFEALDARLLADRAAAELRATGETARRRDPSTLAALTPQELQIARLVAAGASNREAAAQLFLSPKTIEYHLRKVFQKLEIASRADLGRIGFEEDAVTPAGARAAD